MSGAPRVPSGLWFNEVAAFLGPAYWSPGTGRVQAFTKGTVQEVDFLVDALALQPGMRVLDAGCGPGRHSLELARRGVNVVGIDASPDFISLARESARDLRAEFHEMDVRALSYDQEFDAVLCLCQGGFGLLGGTDAELAVIDAFARALRPGGRLALTAFSAYFVIRHLEPAETFDPDTGVNHEQAVVRDERGAEQTFDLWTSCYTPRELRLLAQRAGLTVDGVHSVSPGAYRRDAPSLDTPEYLLFARRPA